MSVQSCYKSRRFKAAVVLTIVWSGIIALNFVPWGFWFVLTLTASFGIHALCLVLARPRPHTDAPPADWLFVSLVVAAKNEEAVIGNLVRALCSQDYPDDRYEVWVVDDHSIDSTPILLEQLAQEYSHLKVLRRTAGAGGGKSGALNQVLPLTQGEIVAVFDADAQVTPDLVQRVLPLFGRLSVGAVQVRKTLTNAQENLWTQAQLAEMAVNSYVQQQRIAIGGMGELWGNGQFIRRTALERCSGWNEETITDDLDLTLRLHLDQWDIDFLYYPAVEEEGVTSAIALWHQHNRWAEGGYQRYLDYWQPILCNRLGIKKTIDLLMFLFIQYILLMAAVPDLVIALARRQMPILTPVIALTLILLILEMFIGLKRVRGNEKFRVSTFFVLLLQTLHGTFYMFHWLVIIASMSIRLCVRSKQLKWVKTVHRGRSAIKT